MPETIGQYRESLVTKSEEHFAAGDIRMALQTQDTADAIEAALEVSNKAVVRNTSKMELEDLDTNVLGQYNLKSKKSVLSRQLIENASADTIRHVMAKIQVHEEGHHQNKENGDSDIISSVAVEEGLTELWTASKLDGKTLTYHAEQSLVHNIASETGESVNTLIGYYGNGENQKINELIDQAANDNQSIERRLAA